MYGRTLSVKNSQYIGKSSIEQIFYLDVIYLFFWWLVPFICESMVATVFGTLVVVHIPLKPLHQPNETQLNGLVERSIALHAFQIDCRVCSVLVFLRRVHSLHIERCCISLPLRLLDAQADLSVVATQVSTIVP